MTVQMEYRLSQRKSMGNLRELSVVKGDVDFASNDYLGLSRSLDLKETVFQELNSQTRLLNGLGSTGSRLLTGNSEYAEALENRIAAFHGYEAGLLFNCGYMANVGLLSTVAGGDDRIYFDANIHASTLDGIRLSRSQAFPFRHNDIEHLERRLKKGSVKGNRFICIESIYSTDGSVAPLKDICDLSEKYKALLIVDEAHAVGLCGIDGRGLVAEKNCLPHVFAQVSTFGKALGVHGAIVLGSNLLKQSLINFATPMIYTTSLPLHSLAAIKCVYDQLPMLEKEREQLKKLIDVFRRTRKGASLTQIQSIPVQGNEALKKSVLKINRSGFDVRGLMSPTVHKGDERLRICLHAFNSEDELLALLELIK
jgi:8-amino-7-oxononanoate synthase